MRELTRKNWFLVLTYLVQLYLIIAAILIGGDDPMYVFLVIVAILFMNAYIFLDRKAHYFRNESRKYIAQLEFKNFLERHKDLNKVYVSRELYRLIEPGGEYGRWGHLGDDVLEVKVDEYRKNYEFGIHKVTDTMFDICDFE